MNEQQLEEKYQLKKAYKIVINNGMPTFNSCSKKPEDKASVYVWASKESKNDSKLKFLYVGKAGYGIKRRLSQHKGGFKNSNVGKRNKELIEKEINQQRSIYVYYRYSETTTIFEKEVSLFSVEEDALCLALSPEWNRAGFPRINTPDENIQTELMTTLNNDLILFRDTDKDELISCLENLSIEATNKFYQLILTAHNIKAKGFRCKLVRGYTGQPTGYNKTPMIIYAERYASNGNAINRIVRIALHDEPKSFDN